MHHICVELKLFKVYIYIFFYRFVFALLLICIFSFDFDFNHGFLTPHVMQYILCISKITVSYLIHLIRKEVFKDIVICQGPKTKMHIGKSFGFIQTTYC